MGKVGFFWWPWSLKFGMEYKYMTVAKGGKWNTTVAKGGKTLYLISLERFSLSVNVEMPMRGRRKFPFGGIL